MNLLAPLPERSRIASFDVDCQNSFTPECPDELPVDGGTEIVAELNAQAEFTAWRVGSKDAHPPNARWVADAEHPPLSPIEGDNMDLAWPVHAVPGTRGFESIAGLPAVTGYDFFVWKGVEPDMHPYGACYHDFARRLSTGVIEFLRSKDAESVIVGGLATDHCVKHTALELREAGFRVILNRAAVRGIAADTVARAFADMAAAGIEFIESAAELNSLARGQNA
ncbi:MAG: isochorismatase family protein [Gammaproteobacteria bacterium]